MIEGATVLVTGGAGTIGRHLIEELLDRKPAVVRVFDNNEPSLSQLRRVIEDERCRFLVGDVRDKDRLERAMQDVDVVIHAAAMKHVHISEYNPFEAIKTNVLGLQNVVDTAIDAGVARVVFTSSDKAAYPANTMGTTKLLGEKLIAGGNKYSGPQDITLTSVRFGNVTNSSESVVQLFLEQIQSGGPVTVTDDRMTRFFLTYSDLSDLVFRALESGRGGEVFVYDMPAVRIVDLAEAMIECFATEYGHSPDSIDIEFTEPRKGETFHEEIMTEREAQRAVVDDQVYAVLPETGANGYFDHPGLDGFSDTGDLVTSSGDAEKLQREEIIALLDRGGVLPDPQ